MVTQNGKMDISTDKSTYIDQIAHLYLLAVSTMPPSTEPVLDTCRNTMWVHMCRHISGTGAAPLRCTMLIDCGVYAIQHSASA